MSSYYDINTFVAVSLLYINHTDSSEIITILAKNNQSKRYPTKFDADLYEDILFHLHKTFPEWIRFIMAQKAADVKLGVDRLRAGRLGRLDQNKKEPTFEALKRTWMAFVKPGPLMCVLNDEGELNLLETVESSGGELVTLSEVEFFDKKGNRIPV